VLEENALVSIPSSQLEKNVIQLSIIKNSSYKELLISGRPVVGLLVSFKSKRVMADRGRIL